MTRPVSPPPDRELPRHARHRARLLAAIEADGGGERAPGSAARTFLVPLVAAASVLALAGGAAAVVQWARSGDPAGPEDIATAGGEIDPAARPGGEIESLRTREITGAELRRFYQDCVAVSAAHDLPDNLTRDDRTFEDFDRPLFAFGVDVPDGSGYPDAERRAWLVAASGDGSQVDDRAVCVRDDGEEPFHTGAPMRGYGPKGNALLYQIVGGTGVGAGLFVPPASTVTFQPKVEGGKETSAVVRDGMWFYPERPQVPAFPEEWPNDPEELERELEYTGNKLIGLPDADYRYRAYDQDGELVYDSEKDGPLASDCYTDPEGEKVITVGSVENPTPETCHRTYRWSAPSGR